MNKLSFVLLLFAGIFFSNGTHAQNAALSDPNKGGVAGICGDSALRINLLPARGGSQKYVYQWQSSTDTSGTWSMLRGQTGEDLVLKGITKETFFRRQVTDGSQTIYSGIYRTKNYPGIYAGYIRIRDTVLCQNSFLTIRPDSVPQGGDGRFRYSWEENSGSWTEAGDFDLSYRKSWTATRLVRLRIEAPVCNVVTYSDTVRVITRGRFNQSNYIEGEQVLCSPDTAEMISGNELNADDALYFWYSSPSPDNGWKLIPKATGSAYSPGIVGQTTFYKRIAAAPSLFCDSSESNVVSIIVGKGKPFVVNNLTDDIRDAKCGSLRYAINMANETPGVFDTITFDLPFSEGHGLYLNSPLLLREPVYIKGPGADKLVLINFNGAVFAPEPSFRTEQPRLEATNPYTISGLSFGYSKHAVSFTSGDLLVKNCHFYYNSPLQYYAGGGALFFNGNNLTIDSCRFDNNSAASATDASGNIYYSDGAAVSAESQNGLIEIKNSTFEFNTGGYGDTGYEGKGQALFLHGNYFKARVDRCTFSDNKAASGAAIYFSSENFADTLIISNSTISGNVAKEAGAGVFMEGTEARMEVFNSTIYNNGEKELILSNRRTFRPAGGGIYANGGKVFMQNSIFAGNRASQGADAYLSTFRGTLLPDTILTSLGNNLFGDTSAGSSTIILTKTDFLTSETFLAPLGNYGGITKTHLPLIGSKAIDNGSLSNEKTDQRGFARIAGERPDVGPVEAGPSCKNPLVVSSLDNKLQCGTLPYAVIYANLKTGKDTITFSPALAPGDIRPINSLNITGGLTVTGKKGMNIIPGGTDNLVIINTKESVTITDLSFKSSQHSFLPAVYQPVAECSLNLKRVSFENNYSNGGIGAALYAAGISTDLDSCRFINNKVYVTDDDRPTAAGGAFLFAADSSNFRYRLSVTNSEFDQNTLASRYSSRGGAVGLKVAGAMTKAFFSNNSFVRNKADAGGALYIDGYIRSDSVFLNNNTFSTNYASSGGGAIHILGGDVVMNSNTVYRNVITDTSRKNMEFPMAGGGVYLYEGELWLENNIISSNTTPGLSADIMVSRPNTLFSLGHNFISDTTSEPNVSVAVKWGTSDYTGNNSAPLDPLLKPLAYNNGFTLNHFPYNNSPVINNGSSKTILKTDQRKAVRPFGKTADIGSVESDFVPPVVFAGRDTSTCDSLVQLKATPAPTGYRGFWSIKGIKAGGKYITDTTKAQTTAKFVSDTTEYTWTITNGTDFTSADHVTHVHLAAPAQPVITAFSEACGSSFDLVFDVPYSDANANKYKWTKKGTGRDTLQTVKVSYNQGPLLFRTITTISNYSQGENIISLETTGINGCVRIDSDTLLYYPFEKPVLPTDTIVYDESVKLSVNPVKRGIKTVPGSWKVREGSATLSDTNAVNPVISKLPLGNTRVTYTLKNYCKRSDTLLIIRRNPVDSAEAGPNKTICDSTTNLEAVKPLLPLQGVWRSSNPHVKFTDSTLYNTKVYGLPGDTTILYWVVKKTVPDVDSMFVINNKVEAFAGSDSSFCDSAARFSPRLPGKGQFGQWSLIEGDARILSSRTANSEVILKKVLKHGHKFLWTVTKGNCTDTNSVRLYRSDTVKVTDVRETVAAGDILSLDISENNIFSLLDLKLISKDTVFTPQPYKSITHITFENEFIRFHTNRKAIVKADSVQYWIRNQCAATDSGYFIIETLNRPPYEVITSNPVFNNENGKISFTLRSKDLDFNENVISVRDSGNTFSIPVSRISDSAFYVEFPYEQLSPDVESYNLRLWVCDSLQECRMIEILLEIPSKLIVYNALSPNGDNMHDFFEIQGIVKYPDNKVVIRNRWGDVVYNETGYNNNEVRFDGKNLPDGTYYYFIDLGAGENFLEGFIIVKR